jgi:uncharacterized protein YcfJ
VKHTLLTALPLAITLCSCATGPYGEAPNAGKRAVVGAAAGAAVGAAAGAAAGDVVSGAALGAIAGGAIGALVPANTVNGRQYYRDTRGYCYYIDANGKPQYDGTVRC